ncbi:efflux RND transporter periplasmic adaptor subunit [Flaviaesturariibacter amylovorans]|uniref:Efflux RND transporter periplasmic adaptor subunit n=1 Tax=Flaviaesturariibacter amylovorans TaxID=1084520 RepID=A0ABP8HKA4_9BACT
MRFNSILNGAPVIVGLIALLLLLNSCTSSSASPAGPGAPPPPALPVITVQAAPATIYQEYSAALEGSRDIEILPQVEGIIEAISVDEGARVRRGQLLFRINDRVYREQLNTARAALAAARASLTSAQIHVDRLKPLVEKNVVSDVQLRSAQAAANAASAQVAQAAAVVRSAEVNLGYTRITAPADGYIGRIPMKVGSLVGAGTPEPLTVLSELKTVYAYFSLGEEEFLRFKERYAGATVEQKIRGMAPVELRLPDGTSYTYKGKVELVTGQFSGNTGSIAFRAAFANPDGLLRSGNTGTVRLPVQLPAAAVVPQEATFELQDKVFVFRLADSNKVVSVPIAPAATSGTYYLLQEGVKPGDRLVYTGLDRLKDGAVIQPQPLPMDSLLKVRPL